MSALKPAVTTTLSTKGQLILPKAVRESRGWGAGTQLVIEEHGEALLLREEPSGSSVRSTRMDEVYGMFDRDGRSATTDDMKRAAAEGAAERYRLSFASDEPRE